MTETEQRAAVLAETRSWLGTFYHHEGEVKCTRDAAGKIVDRGGVDCAKLLYCVFHRCGFIPAREIPHYPPDWHLHRDEERYLKIVFEHAREIPETEAKPADVVLYQWGRCWAHGGIIVEPGWPHVIHALRDAGQVIEDLGTAGRLLTRPRKFMSYW